MLDVLEKSENLAYITTEYQNFVQKGKVRTNVK